MDWQKHTLKMVLAGAALILALLLNSCSESDPSGPSEEAQPPEIPPASTLIMDFSAFDTAGTALAKRGLPGAGHHILGDATWRWAALKVGLWNVVLTVNLALPVAAFVESFKHEPEQLPDGTWQWAYSFGLGNSARLTARAEDGNIQWAMYLSKPNGYSDFLWFTGESNLVNTEGTWHLNAAPNNPVPYIDILWHINPQSGAADVQYTNVIPNHAGNGSTIFYGVGSPQPFDAFYNIANTEIDNQTTIEWNRSDFHGRIRDPWRYGNSDWHCWDTRENGLVDVDCP